METEALFRNALVSELPTAFCLTRQRVPTLKHHSEHEVSKGAYVFNTGKDLLIIATGSEVHLALTNCLNCLPVSIISMHRLYLCPCWEMFALQDKGLPRLCDVATMRETWLRLKQGQRSDGNVMSA